VFLNRLVNAVTNVTIGRGPGTFPIVGFVPAGGTLYMRRNAGTVNAYGLEADAERQVGETLTLRLAAAWTHARVDGGSQAPQLTGLRPAQTPEITVTAGAVWRPVARITLTGAWRFESVRYDDDQNTRPIAAGSQLDLKAQWAVTPSLAAFVAADNITDAHLQTGRSAAGVVTYDAPRVVRLGIAWGVGA